LGRHAQLLAIDNGMYASMWQEQIKTQKELDGDFEM
jgi:hypothetical protein